MLTEGDSLPWHRIPWVKALAAVALIAVSGCGPIQVPPPATLSPEPTFVSVPSPTASTFLIVPVTMADASNCPSTLGEPAPESIPGGEFFGSGSSFGNGKLWVGGLWPDGIILGDPRFIDADGAVSMKFGWWRVAPGRLQITGFRRDPPAPPAMGDVPDGYGESGFQASGVRFATEGCWAITGTVGSSSLTFLTFVIKVPAPPSVGPTP